MNPETGTYVIYIDRIKECTTTSIATAEDLAKRFSMRNGGCTAWIMQNMGTNRKERPLKSYRNGKEVPNPMNKDDDRNFLI